MHLSDSFLYPDWGGCELFNHADLHLLLEFCSTTLEGFTLRRDTDLEEFKKKIWKKKENCHLTTIIIIINLGENHRDVKQVGENFKRGLAYFSLCVSPHSCLLISNRKIITRSYHLNQMIKVENMSNGMG